MEQLTSKHCVPCEGGMAPLTRAEFTPLLAQVPGWSVIEDDKKITREFEFKNFVEVLAFVNKVGEIAEAEGHHPNLNIHEYKHLTITNYTHAIGGLSENDFILGAKINELIKGES